MVNIEKVTYEQSVSIIEAMPEMQSLIEAAYLDADIKSAWARYESSEEWAETRSILRLDKTNRSLRILDLGCGNGLVSQAFANLGHKVIALDPDRSKRVGCGALDSDSKTSIFALQAFAEALPFASKSFDIVYGRQVLHHFYSLEKGLMECRRVLRDGGKALFCREHVIDDDATLGQFLEAHPLHKYHGGENAYTLSRYLNACKLANFIVLNCLGPFDSVINHFPTKNSEVKMWLKQKLINLFGQIIGSRVTRINFLEFLYRKRLSLKCKIPGRMYSFLLRASA